MKYTREPKKEWREQNKAADEVKKSQEINDDHFLSTPFSGASAVQRFEWIEVSFV